MPATKSAHEGSQSACHEICTSSAGARPTPGRTSDPLASSKRRTQHANATGRAPVPSRRQGVHPTPRQAASAAHSAHGGSQRAVPATRSAHGGPQSTAPATKSAHQAPVPSRRQGVHPTPWQAASAAHSTQMLPAERRCPADARAHIRPLGKQRSAVPATRSAHGGSQSTAPATKAAHEGSQSAAPATKSAHPAPVPSRRQGVHPTPWQAARCCACHEICTRRFTTCCACHEICTCSAGAQPTPGRTSDPEGSQSAAPATKSAHPAPVPSRRQGVHPTPWQAAKCCACHEICTRRFTKCCACHEICT